MYSSSNVTGTIKLKRVRHLEVKSTHGHIRYECKILAEIDALRRSSRISRKETIRNVTIRQQIGPEVRIIK
jgi:hypothetical protein